MKNRLINIKNSESMWKDNKKNKNREMPKIKDLFDFYDQKV